jgi:hypothetical protein
MIAIPRSDPAEQQWREWRDRARVATARLIERVAHGEEPEVDDRIYKEAMSYLLTLSKGKCAYCESNIPLTHPGDVEHFRPKGRIRDHLTGKIVRLPDDSRDHPGYWWLAYEWENLLPSCIDCNRRRRHDNELGGKGEFFPLRGNRALQPGEEANEEPLLLNPSSPSFSTADHFEFHEDGMIKPISDAGAESCKIFALNLREPLVMARRQRFKEAKRAFNELLNTLIAHGLGEDALSEHEIELRREINQMWMGEAPYGACTREALGQIVEVLASRGFPVRLPLQVPA